MTVLSHKLIFSRISEDCGEPGCLEVCALGRNLNGYRKINIYSRTTANHCLQNYSQLPNCLQQYSVKMDEITHFYIYTHDFIKLIIELKYIGSR